MRLISWTLQSGSEQDLVGSFEEKSKMNTPVTQSLSEVLLFAILSSLKHNSLSY
jgi:hypothetical protein